MNETERKTWLLSISERDSFKLPMADWYDRIRYEREILAIQHLNKVGYTGVAPQPKKSEPRSNFKGMRVIKNWMVDK